MLASQTGRAGDQAILGLPWRRRRDWQLGETEEGLAAFGALLIVFFFARKLRGHLFDDVLA